MMRRLEALARRWPAVLAAAGLLAALGLGWLTRAGAVSYGALLRADALSAWFGALALAGLLASLAASRVPARRALALLPLLASYALASTLGIALGFLAAAVLLALPGRAQPRRAWLEAAPLLLAALCLLAGYGALALGGAAVYDARLAGAALSSPAFGLVLLAALLPIGALARAEYATGAGLLARCLAPAWLYPLARLYSLGPWNAGWSLAALLLGGALACWCALAALFRAQPAGRAACLSASALAGALAGLGLGTNAGAAAACYAALCYLLLVAGLAPPAWLGRAAPLAPTELGTWLPWLFSSAFPFAAPFAAAWMLIGASMAGGAALLAGALWLAALLGGLVGALWGPPADAAGLHRPVALASALVGIGAPLVLRGPIEPVVAQLQGGLSLYGDVNVWPWVGLAAADAAHVPVATWPSIALALLMLVLCALVYTCARLGTSTPAVPSAPVAEAAPAGSGAALRTLRDDVPWLALVLGPASAPDELTHDVE